MTKTVIACLLGFLVKIGLVGMILLAPAGLTGMPAIQGEQHLSGSGLIVERSKLPPMLLSDQNKRSQSNSETVSGQDQPASNDQKTGQPGSESDAKPRKEPLKPFNPSERIKADQAVDFPSDI